MRKKICLVSNTAWSFTRFRIDLLRALVQAGNEVMILAPSDQYVGQLESLGLDFVPLFELSNQGSSPYQDIRLLQEFKRIYREKKPDLVIQYTVKPNVYSTLAARACGIPVIAVVTGLGYAFINKGLVTRIVMRLYRYALRKANQVWFLNEDDRSLFLGRKLVQENKTKCIPGEGIDCLNMFNPQNVPEVSPNSTGKTYFLFVGRLLHDKGIREFVAAARQIRRTYPDTRFQILGYLNVENPAAVKKDELDSWVAEGVVDYLGDTVDVRPRIMQADCVVLPSYREGMSTTLQESASLGKPLIASDIAGCRELIDDGVTGYLCGVKDVASLVGRMVQFLELEKRQQVDMGRRGREKMIAERAVDMIIETYKTEISRLIG